MQAQTALVAEINLSQIDNSWESLCEVGRLLSESNDRNRWAIGDLAARVEITYGDQSLDDFASKIKVFAKTLQSYRAVSRFYQFPTRGEFPALSWSHYREAMRLGTVASALLLLAHVQDNNLSIRDMGRLIRLRLGKPAKNALIGAFVGTFDAPHHALLLLDGATVLEAGKRYAVKVYSEEAT